MLTKLKELPSVDFITEADVAKHLMHSHEETPGEAKSFIEHYAGYDFLLHGDDGGGSDGDDSGGCSDDSHAVQQRAVLVQEHVPTHQQQEPAERGRARTPSPPPRQAGMP